MRCPSGIGSEEQRGSSTAPCACKRVNRTPGLGGRFAACGSALCREPSALACELSAACFGARPPVPVRVVPCEDWGERGLSGFEPCGVGL